MTVGPDVTVILAAGAGTRLGGQGKALLRVGGETLAERALRSARAAETSPLLVLGHRAAEVRAALSQEASWTSAEIVDCSDWGQGLAASLRAGVRAAAERGVGRVAVVLVDQPGISSTALRRVLRAHTPGRITRGVVRGAATHPVVFDLGTAQEAATLAVGDEGARTYLRAHPELIDAVDISDVAEPADIDTPEDLSRWEPDTRKETR
ncbi:nucleotidyltransferase family protein [Nesterenkonia sp. CF4.4]|uniref:nucleotidyltransferase family protein n=1 Tax=Nesterenkonia sp. CF4.4 TaxID=3373079 RepID=UPI003EE60DDA